MCEYIEETHRRAAHVLCLGHVEQQQFSPPGWKASHHGVWGPDVKYITQYTQGVNILSLVPD